MRILIVFYAPEFMKQRRQPTADESAQSFEVTFREEIVAPKFYEKVAEFESERNGRTNKDILDTLWQMTQNDFYVTENPENGEVMGGWYQALMKTDPRMEGQRSSMVGDLFAIDDDWYVIRRTGFSALPLDFNDLFSKAFLS